MIIQNMGTTHLMTQHHTQEDLNPQMYVPKCCICKDGGTARILQVCVTL
jgi:hypothetical protein